MIRLRCSRHVGLYDRKNFPFSGVWSCWTDWSPCSVTCGLGKKSRTRDCLTAGKDGCEGLSTEFETCELPLCDCKCLLQTRNGIWSRE